MCWTIQSPFNGWKENIPLLLCNSAISMHFFWNNLEYYLSFSHNLWPWYYRKSFWDCIICIWWKNADKSAIFFLCNNKQYHYIPRKNWHCRLLLGYIYNIWNRRLIILSIWALYTSMTNYMSQFLINNKLHVMHKNKLLEFHLRVSCLLSPSSSLFSWYGISVYNGNSMRHEVMKFG